MSRGYARTFGQDLMRGEHTVGAPPPMKTIETASLKSGLVMNLTAGCYRAAGSEVSNESSAGTSIFDPVLCELAYRWFCPPGGAVLDPFAGGSVRGIVAGVLGYRYHGVDLRPEQIAANYAQSERIGPTCAPTWYVGDSRDVCPQVDADFVFSCPPYADLERYSDDPRDLSTMDYAAFRGAYADIIAKYCARLAADRFAAFVVGDVRDKAGNYRGFPYHTIEAFQSAGLSLYNEAVLITVVGSLPVRVGKQFTVSRKLGKSHQNVLVFVKGNPKRAAAACQ